VRKEDISTGWASGAQKSDVSKPGGFANYPYTLLGTQRNGPDLSIIGRRISDMQYHIDHLKHPREFKPQSIMPSYAHLSERDLKDLAAYMVSLGNDPEDLRSGEVGGDQGEAGGGVASAGEQVKTGKQLFNQKGCVGCHSSDGSSNGGPTMSDLYGAEVQLKSGETVVADEAFLRESIVEPQATLVQGYPPVMPNRYGDMPDDELDAMVAYIRFLGGEGSS
jgi:cbb3-type cytochrome oxidase cytochrome c subunit